jgi:hypothetical protein
MRFSRQTVEMFQQEYPWGFDILTDVTVHEDSKRSLANVSTKVYVNGRELIGGFGYCSRK